MTSEAWRSPPWRCPDRRRSGPPPHRRHSHWGAAAHPVPFQFPGFQGQADLGRLWNPFGIRRRCSLRCSHRCRYFQNRFHLCWRNQADSVRRCLLGHQFRFRRPCFQNRCRRESFRTNHRNDRRKVHCLRRRCPSQDCPQDRCAATRRRESLPGREFPHRWENPYHTPPCRWHTPATDRSSAWLWRHSVPEPAGKTAGRSSETLPDKRFPAGSRQRPLSLPHTAVSPLLSWRCFRHIRQFQPEAVWLLGYSVPDLSAGSVPTALAVADALPQPVQALFSDC